MVHEYVRICAEEDIGEGAVKGFEINNRPVALAKYQGTIYAIDDICTHDEGNLGEGDVVNGQIQCPRHGARFDLKTGQATRMPAVIGINTYEVKIEGSQVYISMPD
jgi:3-phenylpropionate/trans-cinnamate dioxygenase ferredoxin subunit